MNAILNALTLIDRVDKNILKYKTEIAQHKEILKREWEKNRLQKSEHI